MKLNILNIKLRTMNAANAASEQPASVDTIEVSQPTPKPERKLSAASLKAEAEDAQMEEAVQELVKGSGVSIGSEKTDAPAKETALTHTAAPINPEKPTANAKRTATSKRKPTAKPTPKAKAAKKAATPKPISTPVGDEYPEITVKAHHNDVFIKDYSEKSFAVFGETKPIKDYLKACGGRFNPCLHPFGPSSSVPGWIFPLKAREAVERVIC